MKHKLYRDTSCSIQRALLCFFFFFAIFKLTTSVLTVGCFQQANVKSPSCSLYSEATAPHGSQAAAPCMGQGSAAQPQRRPSSHLLGFESLSESCSARAPPRGRGPARPGQSLHITACPRARKRERGNGPSALPAGRLLPAATAQCWWD